MEPGGHSGQTDEEIEIQMAIALSLQEVVASQLEPSPRIAPPQQPPQSTPNQPQPASGVLQGASQPTGLGAAPSGAGHTPPAAGGVQNPQQLQSMLAQMLGAAMAGNAGAGGLSSSTTTAAPAAASRPATAHPSSSSSHHSAQPAPRPQSASSSQQGRAHPSPGTGNAGTGTGMMGTAQQESATAAAELARQFAMFQQSLLAGGSGLGMVIPQSVGTSAGSSSNTGITPPAAAPVAVARPTTAPARHSTRPAPSGAPAAGMLHQTQAALPDWCKPLKAWWSDGPAAPAAAAGGSQGAQQGDISLGGEAQLKELHELLSKALGVRVVGHTEPAGAGLTLKSASGPGGGVVVKAADLSALLGLWLRRPSLIASGTSQLRALANAYDALHTGSGQLAGAAEQLGRLMGQLAFQLLATDEEDLYFEGGQHTNQLLRDLRTPWRRGTAGMNPSFLAAIAGAVHDDASAAAMAKLLRTILEDFKSVKQLGQSAVELEPLALSLDTVTAPPALQRCLAYQLIEEATRMAVPQLGIRSPAKALEAASVLSPPLQVSSLVEPLSVLSHRVASRAAATFTQLKGFPLNEGEVNTTINVVGSAQARLQDVVHGMLKRLVTLKDGGVGREVVLAWLAGAARLNWERVLAGERGISAQAAQEMSTGASDGWCVNLAAVCLRFARPFVTGYWTGKSSGTNKFADLFDKHLSPLYYCQQPHRLPDLHALNSLAGERGTSIWDAIQQLPDRLKPAAAMASSQSAPWLSGSISGSGGPSFIAECFFLTQTWLHVGLMPALYRYQRLYEILHSALTQQGPMDPKAPHPLATQLALLTACERAALLETQLVEDTVQFCMLQLAWLHHLVRQPDAPTLFSLIPEYVLADSLTWLHFIITSGLAVHVASKDISSLTYALAALLDARACVRSPVLADKCGRLLLAMLAPQLGVSKRAEVVQSGALGTRGMLAATVQRPGEAALVAAVLNSPAAQSGELAGALMRAYVAADHVVGLDVDRDSFDKFTMRSCIDSILEELWRDEGRGRRSLVNLLSPTSAAASAAGGSGGAAQTLGGATFDEYVSCLFNSLIYLFKDSLDRLVDIAKVEALKADAAGWAARPKEEQQQQDAFLRSQAQTCRGFMRIAVQSLNWLTVLAAHPQAGAALCRHPLSGRVAYSVLHFMELLSNSKAQQLKVERPEQYQWDRPLLLSRVVGLATNLARSSQGAAFTDALAAEPDLDLGMLQQVQTQLEAGHKVTESTQLSHLIDSLASKTGQQARRAAPASKVKTSPLRAAEGEPDAQQQAANGSQPPSKRTKVAAAGGDAEMHDAAATTTLVYPDGGPVADEVMADAGGSGATASLVLPGPELSSEELSSQYKQQLGEVQLDTFDAGASRAYHSAFNTMAAESAAAPAPAMMKRVAKEVRDLSSGKTALPCEPAASIYLRWDAVSMHKMRALITGPEGTPYAYGCFVFDLLFPPGYPTTPMLVHFETTGQGRARFNPNLYADGKVCLSLINTWHAAHESEKWSPERTTTFQVLVSIQAMILVEDPYYNEPAHEAARGTDVGRSSAAMYNAQLTLSTLRWAILDKLKHPPPGLEEVVRRHFRLLRHKVLAQAQAWGRAADATGDDILARRTHAAVSELHQLLSGL